MKALTSYLSRFFHPAAIVILVQVGLSLFSSELRAGATIPTPVVGYDATIVQIQGQFPFRTTYTFNLQAPSNLTDLLAGGTAQISFAVSMNGKPSGVSDQVALGYVTIATPIVSFSAGGQIVPVTVTLDVPSDAVPGPYGYKILALGWPVDPALGLTNIGEFINATVTAPSAVYTPPDVVIGTPQDNWTTSVNPNSFPVSVPLTFTATSTGTGASPITDANVTVGGNPVTLSSLFGMSTTSVTGSGNMSIAAPGTYTVVATANNRGGPGADTNSFTINVTAPPPTVSITAPTPGSTFSYRAGGTAVPVSFVFTANSNYGGIRDLTAKVDGIPAAFIPTGIGSLTASGTIGLSYSAAGTHTLEVTTTDDYGTAIATSNFTVVVVTPTPAITITAPTDTQIFDIAAGQTTTSVPYRFVTTSNNGFVVDSVSAMLGTTPVSGITTTGLSTATATSTGTLTGLTAGTYTLSAMGVSAGINVSTSVRFTVRSVAILPSVVINTPPAGSTYVRLTTGPALSIPLTFTGTSNTPGGVITQLTASLGTTALSVATTNLNTAVAQGSATLSVTNAGTYTISVTALDAYGTASATRSFTVTVEQAKTISGNTFFDINFDGLKTGSDYGLSGVTVKLLNASNQVVATTVSNACGDYSFANLTSGTYTVSATAAAGLKATSLNERTVTVGSANVCVPNIGFGLDFNAIRTMTANGFTIGYWKNNLDKAISGKTAGIQVPAGTLSSYTTKIGAFALPLYDGITQKTASSIMGSTSSAPVDLLSKQLVGSEYNYQNAAYLNGNKTLTFAFLYWGEYVKTNSTQYSSTYLIWAKDWFDAYNNSHGGVVAGPQ